MCMIDTILFIVVESVCLDFIFTTHCSLHACVLSIINLCKITMCLFLNQFKHKFHSFHSWCLRNKINSTNFIDWKQSEKKEGREEKKLHPDVLQFVPDHFQATLDPRIRTKILARYPRVDGLPKPLKDSNGVVLKSIKGPKLSKSIQAESTNQKRIVDLLRVGTTALQSKVEWGLLPENQKNKDSLIDKLIQALVDIVQLLAFEGHRSAVIQINSIMEERGITNILDIVDLSKIDPSKDSILQEIHITTLNDLQKLHFKAGNNQRPNSRFKNKGRSGNGSWNQPWRSSFRGKGRGRSRSRNEGRGDRQSPFRQAQNQNNET